MRYEIVLYNAGKRKKSLKSFRKYSEANEFYQLNLSTNYVLFPKLKSWTGTETDFELVLLGPPEGKALEYIQDEMGRTVTLKAPDGCTIKKIEPYYVEESFLHKNSKKRMFFKDFVKMFIVVNRSPKVFHTVANKLIIEYTDNENVDLFVLKNTEDAERLNETIREFCYANNIFDHLFFPKTTIETRRQLYDKIVEIMKIPRDYLQRTSTR